MPKDLRSSNESVNAAMGALGALANSGYIRIYDGTRPATADTALSGQVLLAELRFNGTAFGGAVDGVLTANAITADAAADNTGTATWYRALKSNGTSPLWDGTVGTADSDIVLNSVTIPAGAQVSVSSLTLSLPKA